MLNAQYEAIQQIGIRNRVSQRNVKQLNCLKFTDLTPSLTTRYLIWDDRTPVTSRSGFITKRKLDYGKISPRNLFQTGSADMDSESMSTSTETPSSPPREDPKSPEWDMESLKPIADVDQFK